MKYDVLANPCNPVEYLACCGVFEILSRFDANAAGWWEPASPSHFSLETAVAEALLLSCLTGTLTDLSAWQSFGDEIQESADVEDQDNEAVEALSDESDDAETNDDGSEGVLLSPSFRLNERQEVLRLDWWYETLTKQHKIRNKSAWKMYAGQQTAERIVRDMTKEAYRLRQEKLVESISTLLRLSAGMTGRFGFDPRSSRNSLDTGFSANDLKLPIETYPFAELLAGIGAQYFFPQRTRQGGGITSSRGWIENKLFRFALWQLPLPITLARLAASGAAVQEDMLLLLRAGRANRDKYSNFKMATISAWRESGRD